MKTVHGNRSWEWNSRPGEGGIFRLEENSQPVGGGEAIFRLQQHSSGAFRFTFTAEADPGHLAAGGWFIWILGRFVDICEDLSTNLQKHQTSTSMVDDGTLCLLMYLTMNVYETRLDRALSALSNLTFFILVSPLCDGVTRGGPPPQHPPSDAPVD